jgi:hypothetical protein
MKWVWVKVRRKASELESGNWWNRCTKLGLPLDGWYKAQKKPEHPWDIVVYLTDKEVYIGGLDRYEILDTTFWKNKDRRKYASSIP